jgi:uncharacterized protein YegL
MNTSNTKQWSSAAPGYIIFLVDQSGSMNESYAEGRSKAEFTALVINRTINELVNHNMDGEKVKDRAFISIIGYGGQGGNLVNDVRSEYLSNFADNPIRVESFKKKISDGAGGLIEITEEMPISIEPLANGFTPMGDALAFAKQLIEGWMQKKPDNPAPIVINISDGLPYNGGQNGDEKQKALNTAKEIMAIHTADGNPVILNAHIGNGSPKAGFEENESELHDEQAKFLFNISSIIPDAYKASARKHDLNVRDKSRGFVSNAEPETMIKFINFGSSGAADLVSNNAAQVAI